MVALGDAVCENGRVDLFACSLLSHEDGMAALSAIEEVTQTKLELGRSRDRKSANRPSRVDMCGRACMVRIHARPHVLGSLRKESASCLAGSAVRMTRDLGLAERAQSAE